MQFPVTLTHVNSNIVLHFAGKISQLFTLARNMRGFQIWMRNWSHERVRQFILVYTEEINSIHIVHSGKGVGVRAQNACPISQFQGQHTHSSVRCKYYQIQAMFHCCNFIGCFHSSVPSSILGIKSWGLLGIYLTSFCAFTPVHCLEASFLICGGFTLAVLWKGVKVLQKDGLLAL